MIANHGQRVLLSNKNKQNPCRDYFLSPSRKGRKDCAQRITKNMYSIPTKTSKTLAVIIPSRQVAKDAKDTATIHE